MKKRRPGKPQGMNLVQAKQWEKMQFDAIVETAAQEIVSKRVEHIQQYVIDAAFFAVNDMFHLGPNRCKAYGQLILSYANEIAQLIYDDGKDDPEIIYAKAKIDQRMKQICGENFDPWEVRYGKQMPNHGEEERGNE